MNGMYRMLTLFPFLHAVVRWKGLVLDFALLFKVNMSSEIQNELKRMFTNCGVSLKRESQFTVECGSPEGVICIWTQDSWI